jgi:methyl-accepting chemotaxis protein
MIRAMVRLDTAPVAVRILGGLAFALVLILALVGSSLHSSVKIERDANWVWAKTREAAASGALSAQLGELNADLAEYALSESDADLKTARSGVAKFGQMLTALGAETERADTIEPIRHLAALYTAAIEAALKAIDLRRSHAARLNYSGTELRTTLSAIGGAAMRDPAGVDDLGVVLRMVEAFHNSLGFASRFLATRNPSDAEIARSELLVLEAKLQQMSGSVRNSQIQRFLQATSEPLKAYSTALDAVIAATERFEAAGTERDKAAVSLRTATEEMRRASTEGRGVALATTIDRLHEQFWIQVAVAAASLGIFVLIASMVTRSVTRPIRDITAALRALAGGELDTTVPHVGNRDEIGHMARAAEIFRANMARVAALELEKGHEQQAREARVRTVERLNASFEAKIGGLVASLSRAAGTMTETAEKMFVASDTMNGRSGSVAAAASQSSAQIQLVAASTEEFAHTIEDISHEVSRASQMAGSAVAGTVATDENIRQLASRTQQIGNIVSFVRDIATQTNLLALNATIEAARAGVAGRGFAVVANEVKDLASQTARATGEISQSIADVQDATGQTIAAIQEIALTIEKMDQAGQAVSASVLGQEAAIREIAENIASAALGTQQVTADLDDLRRAAADTGDAAAAVLGAARQLGQGADELRAEVQQFIAEVRAA